MAFNGAEPVRAETLERFAEAFAPCGFRREAFYPCYGLAEATLFVTGGAQAPAVARAFDAAALERHRGAGAGGGRRPLVGCGRAWRASEIAIVDPETRGARCRRAGSARSGCAGPERGRAATGTGPRRRSATFGARLAGEPGRAVPAHRRPRLPARTASCSSPAGSRT